MAMSREQLRIQLSDIEPNEHTYDGIGPDEIPLLRELLGDPEPWLAARAVHALSRIASDEAREVVISAAEDSRPEIRVAAATASVGLPPPASDRVLEKLVDDPQSSVRKFALKAISGRNSRALRERARH